MGLGKSSKLFHMVMGFFLFASWVIALAGLSAMQNQVDAKWAFSLQWFILFLQFACGIALPLLAITGYLRKCSTALMTYYGVLSTLWVLFAYQAYSAVRSDVISTIMPTNDWLGASFRSGSVDTARYNTWITGCSFLFIFNFVAILLLSLDLEDDKELVSSADTIPKVTSKKTSPKDASPNAATSATPAGGQPFSGPATAPPSGADNV